MLTEFCTKITKLLEANNAWAGGDKTLHMSARLMEFYDNYEANVRGNASEFLGADYHKVVVEEMHETRGTSMPNFLSHPVFCSLLAKETAQLYEPTMALLEEVHKYFDETIVSIPNYFNTVITARGALTSQPTLKKFL